jgi:hypothetical protein
MAGLGNDLDLAESCALQKADTATGCILNSYAAVREYRTVDLFESYAATMWRGRRKRLRAP